MIDDAKKTLKRVIFGIFFLFILGYGFFRSYDLIFGIEIKNVNIIDGGSVNESSINITGNAKNAVNLSLNGRDISINQAGEFSETIALLPGYNIITIEAIDKFGYVDEENYKLMYIQ
jgi:hypothetical protein